MASSPPGVDTQRGVRGQVALFAVLSLVPLLVFAWSSVRITSDAVREQAERQAESSARASASAVQRQLESLSELVASYANRPSLIESIGDPANIDHNRLRFHLRHLRAARPGIDVTFVSDAEGRLLDALPESPEIIGDSFAFRDWYRGVMSTGKPYVSEAYETQVTGGGLVVAGAAPVRVGAAEDGEIVGVLVAGYSLQTIQGFVDAFATTEGVSITITDQRGTLVADAGAAPASLIDRARDPAVAAALHGRSGVEGREVDGEDVLQAYVPIRGLGWTLTASIPKDDAFASVDDVRATVTAVGILVALVLAVALTLLARALRLRVAAEQQLIASENALRLSRERLALAVETAELGTWDWDVEHDTFTASRGVEDVHGTLPDRTFKGWLDTIHPDDRDDVAATARDALEHGDGFEHDFRVVDGDSERWVHVRTRVFRDGEGAARRMVGVVSDVTERRRAENEIRGARQAADDANRAKSEFLSRMSHELRTPLNAILGFSQLLEIDATNDEQRESIGQISRAGTHLLDLINEVLDISRIETGRLALSVEPVAVADVANEALELVRPLARPRGITLPDQPIDGTLHVQADRQRLKQVLLNLLSNAVKYNRDHGWVDLRCEQSVEGWVRIAVADSGPGIAPEKLSRLFTPFERLGAEQSTVEGTGLGLALSSRLAEAMTGRMGIDTQPGEGSTFWIELPEAEAPVLRAADTVAPVEFTAAIQGSRRVLYIEDNLSNVQLVERILGRLASVELMVAMRGQHGLELARQHHPDVVLLDLNLPDLDGETVLHRLRADPATRDIPVVIVSADATPGQISRLRESGASDYLTKPFEIRRLLAALEVDAQPIDQPATPAADEGPPAAVFANGTLRADAIAELRTIDERSGTIGRLVRNYIAESHRQAAQLGEAIDRDDRAAIEDILHKMKGGSGMFGAGRLLDLIAEMRGAASNGESSALPVMLAGLVDEHGRVAEALDELFPEPAAEP